MRASYLHAHVEKGVVGVDFDYFGQGLPANHGMLGDDPELIGGQWTLLEENLVGNTYLADVMQGRGPEDGVDEQGIDMVAVG